MNLFSSRARPVRPVAGGTGRATPLWFGPAERPLFGWVHAPKEGMARGAAVLCPPLFLEQDIAYYSFRRLAEELAARGVLAVRFDYDGTGDSAGGDEDPGRVRAWQKSIAAAAALARDCGAPSLVLVGMRAGALLAASAVRATGATGLVAWDPRHSGRRLVREEHALHRLRFGDATIRADGVELPGFVLSTETAVDLEQLAPDAPGSAMERALVLLRSSESIPAPLAAALGDSHLELGEAVGQRQLLEGNGEHQQVPLVTIERIATWVSESFSPPTFAVQAAPSMPRRIHDGDGRPLFERTVRIEPSALFGIETANATPSAGPTVIFVNNGFGSHVGPSRLWVVLARRWAAAGLRCVRLDLSGIGDSPSREGLPEHVVYAPAAFDDLFDAAHFLCPDDTTNVVFVGLCSGGYQALEAAVAHRARGVCVVNPVLRFRPPELDDGLIDPRRRLCRPTTNVSRVARRLPDLGLLSGPRLQTWRQVGFGEPHKSQASWIRELVDSHVDTLCICGEDEAEAIAVEMTTTGRHQDFEVQIYPGLDHALLSSGQRDQVVERMSDHVLSRFTAPTAVVRQDPVTAEGAAPSSWTLVDSSQSARVQDLEDG
jgi:alpha-beta hydrolase superfamily lysophospholipase